MDRKQILTKTTAFFLCFFILFHVLANPMMTYAAPANFRNWSMVKQNPVTLSGGTGYYKITDMTTYGTNGSINTWGENGTSAGTYWTFNPMHVATPYRVAYQKLFEVSYGMTLSLVAGTDREENKANSGTYAWSVEEWDANGNFLWDSGWLHTNQSYTIGSVTQGDSLEVPADKLGSRTSVKYVTIIFRRITDGMGNNAGNVSITPAELAQAFPNLYLCYRPFTYRVANASGTVVGSFNRTGTTSTTALKNYQPADKAGYITGWKITSNSPLVPNWMNGNIYSATQVNEWLTDGKFYHSLFGDVTFTVAYIPNNYTVTYHANGGTTSATAKTVACGDSVDLSPAASKEGYTFIGWSTSPTSRIPLSSYVMPAENVTLYAVYSMEVSDVENHNYPSYTGTPEVETDEVYFLVWITDSPTEYKFYPLTYTKDSNTMVYQYSLPATDLSSFVKGRAYSYQLVVYDNAGNYTVLQKGGSAGETQPETIVKPQYAQTVRHYKQDPMDGSWILFDVTTTLVEAGNVFVPSYVTPPVGYSVSSKDAGGMVSGEKEYCAYYCPNSYTVTYDYWTNGGVHADKDKANVNYGTKVDLSVLAVKDNGYEFVGWNTNPSATTGLETFIMGTEPVTLYAIFEKTIEVTLTERNEEGTIQTVLSKTIYNNTKNAQFHIPENGGFSDWNHIGWSSQRDATAGVIASTVTMFETSDSIHLYALYVSDVIVSYDTNGAGVTYNSVTKERFFNASGDYFYPTFTIERAPERSEYSFVVWKTADGSNYQAGVPAEIKESVLLTAVWDQFPTIKAYDRYFTLEQAKNGFISHTELLRKVTGMDKEDGMLINGTQVIVKDYRAEDFTEITEDEDVEIIYQAIDDFGNVVSKNVTIHVVDTTLKRKSKKYVRFICLEFFADEDGALISAEDGGLEENSIWRTDEVYRNLLQMALAKNTENPEAWFFTVEELRQIKETSLTE